MRLLARVVAIIAVAVFMTVHQFAQWELAEQAGEDHPGLDICLTAVYVLYATSLSAATCFLIHGYSFESVGTLTSPSTSSREDQLQCMK